MQVSIRGLDHLDEQGCRSRSADLIISIGRHAGLDQQACKSRSVDLIISTSTVPSLAHGHDHLDPHSSKLRPAPIELWKGGIRRLEGCSATAASSSRMTYRLAEQRLTTTPAFIRGLPPESWTSTGVPDAARPVNVPSSRRVLGWPAEPDVAEQPARARYLGNEMMTWRRGPHLQALSLAPCDGGESPSGTP